MKKLFVAGALAVLSFATPAAAANVPVNISYPLDIGAFGVPTFGDDTKFAFSTTCPGHNQVEWYIDGNLIGFAEFHDTFSTQFIYSNLGAGNHVFEVNSTCGSDKVDFEIL